MPRRKKTMQTSKGSHVFTNCSYLQTDLNMILQHPFSQKKIMDMYITPICSPVFSVSSLFSDFLLYQPVFSLAPLYPWRLAPNRSLKTCLYRQHWLSVKQTLLYTTYQGQTIILIISIETKIILLFTETFFFLRSYIKYINNR